MAANKKPRKKYRPKPIIQNPVAFVVDGMQPADPSLVLTARLKNHGALKALVSGTATQADWQFVCNALNCSVVLAEDLHIGEEYLDEIKAGMLAHALCGRRAKTHGSFGYTGPQLTAVNTAIEIHDEQLATATVRQMESAAAEVKHRLTRKHFFKAKEIHESEVPQ